LGFPPGPALADYWAQRRRKTPPPIDKTSQWLLKAQDGRCAICKTAFLPDDDRPQTPQDWEAWLTSARKAIVKVVTPEDPEPGDHEPRLVHIRCRDSSDPAHFCPPTSLPGLLEPDARKRAHPVLRGPGHREVSGLPDPTKPRARDC
jgi:RNA-directed DNA polymerase